MISIRQINPDRASLRRFTQFQIDLYRDNPYYVPPLISDDVNTLMPGKNPAFDFCEAAYFMACDEHGRELGRIAAIVNRQVNEKNNERVCRFGFIDFIDDRAVSAALLDAV